LQLPSRGGAFVFCCSSSALHGAKIIDWRECGNGMVSFYVDLDGERFTVLAPRMATELRARYEVALTDELQSTRVVTSASALDVERRGEE
jgi:hypothetical protein